MGWWYKLCQSALVTTSGAIWKIRGFGRPNVPLDGGVLLASNHQSFLDPPAVGMVLPREVHFMARSTLFRNPAFGALIGALNAFPIERDRSDVKGVKTFLTRLRAGQALLVFPEGTRTKDGSVGRMKGGVLMLARRAGVPVVPVLIDGAYDVWPRNRAMPGGGEIRIVFGEPYHPLDEGDVDSGKDLRRRMVALRRYLKQD